MIALTTAIVDANELYTKATEGTEVGQYATGSKQILKSAIDAAQLVADEAESKTAEQLADAKAILDQAVAAFENGKVKAGDATPLTAAVDEARTLHSNAVEGTEVGQYATGSKQVLKAAIDAAQLVVDEAGSKTAKQLTDAKDTLDQAVVAFENGKVKAGDATSLTAAVDEARTLHSNATEGTEVGQYATGSKQVLKAAIDAAQLVVDEAGSKTAEQLADAKDTLNLAVNAFEKSKVVALTGLENVTIASTAMDSSNRITLENGETLVLTSSDVTNAVATVTEDPNGTVKVTGVGAGGPITIVVQVKKDGQIIKSGTFTVTVTSTPTSITSKSITNLDFSTVQATQAKLVSKPVTVGDFTGNRKDFTIRVKKGARVDDIPVYISWKLSTDFSKGLSMGSVVESHIQQFYVDKDIANKDPQYTELMTRPVMATGNYENDQFYIGTFSTGSQATITLIGPDWQYFFENNQAQGTDIDTSKNRTFTISDGTATATIQLTSKFETIDALIDHINNRLTNAGVKANVEKVGTSQFKISPTATGSIVLGGANKNDFFN